MSSHSGIGPELEALEFTRRWMMLIAVLIAWSVQFVLGLAAWTQLPTDARILLILTVPCAIASVVFRNSAAMPWFLGLPLLLPIIAAIALLRSGPGWVSIGTMFSYLGYLIVLFVGRRIGLIVVILVPAALALLWSFHPASAVPGPLNIAGGWIYVFQLGAAMFFTWWAWQVLRREAVIGDEAVALLEQRTRRSLEISERAAVWRETVGRIHETVLNTLRYLIATEVVDRARLAEFGHAGVLPKVPDRGQIVTPVVPRSEISTPFDKGRFLITAIIAGNAMGGALYALAWLAQVGARGIPVTALTWASMAIVLALIVTRRRLRHPWSIVIILIPALIPWFIRLVETGQCEFTSVAGPMVNASGFCIIVVTAWSGRVAGIIGLFGWGLGSILVAMNSNHSCATFLYLAIFNSLIALPLILTSTYLSTAAYVRARTWARSIRREEIIARTRAEASMDVAEQLSDVIDQAMGEIRSISNGAVVDDATRIGLRVLDARIRAAMQVDPRSAGAFVTLAQALVDEFAMRGVRVQVRGLNGSSDLRELPEPIIDRIYSLLDSAATGEVALQCLNDTLNDYLSLVVPTSFLEGFDVAVGEEVTVEDVSLAVEETDRFGGVVQACAIVVTRPAQMAADSL